MRYNASCSELACVAPTTQPLQTRSNLHAAKRQHTTDQLKWALAAMALLLLHIMGANAGETSAQRSVIEESMVSPNAALVAKGSGITMHKFDANLTVILEPTVSVCIHTLFG